MTLFINHNQVIASCNKNRDCIYYPCTGFSTGGTTTDSFTFLYREIDASTLDQIIFEAYSSSYGYGGIAYQLSVHQRPDNLSPSSYYSNSSNNRYLSCSNDPIYVIRDTRWGSNDSKKFNWMRMFGGGYYEQVFDSDRLVNYVQKLKRGKFLEEKCCVATECTSCSWEVNTVSYTYNVSYERYSIPLFCLESHTLPAASCYGNIEYWQKSCLHVSYKSTMTPRPKCNADFYDYYYPDREDGKPIGDGWESKAEITRYYTVSVEPDDCDCECATCIKCEDFNVCTGSPPQYPDLITSNTFKDARDYYEKEGNTADACVGYSIICPDQACSSESRVEASVLCCRKDDANLGYNRECLTEKNQETEKVTTRYCEVDQNCQKTASRIREDVMCNYKYDYCEGHSIASKSEDIFYVKIDESFCPQYYACNDPDVCDDTDDSCWFSSLNKDGSFIMSVLEHITETIEFTVTDVFCEAIRRTDC